MSSFANDLSDILAKHTEYLGAFRKLQTLGAYSTLPRSVAKDDLTLEKEGLAQLLYCASVFVQADKELYKRMAQSIALNSLLISTDLGVRERCTRILSELGNFPALIYADQHFALEHISLLGQLQRQISQELNSINIGGEKLALTDYQKMIWNILPENESLAISAPTSAGKSFLVIEHICRLINRSPHFSAVYVAPTRALLAEVYQTFQSRLKNTTGLRISAVPSLDAEMNPRQLFILTQERLQVLLAVTDIKFDLAVVDEAQNLSDGARGMILQETLEELTQSTNNSRVIMLAPNAEGFSEAATAIGISSVKIEATDLSPVLQNRIVVTKIAGANQLKLSLLSSQGTKVIGTLSSDRGFDIPTTRLATVALELGSTGGSLVYATGPSDAEKVSIQIFNGRENLTLPSLNDLGSFIEQHIHPNYKLATLVRRGVAFHYGRMPTLLRESLENEFKKGNIQFLVCTTTLFQGVNLPARNVFIDTPTRGEKTILDPALIWNFAGRAGRMKKDIVGNVFLVDYEDWPEKPMNEFVKFRIKPALKTTLNIEYDKVLAALNGAMPSLSPSDDTPSRIRASAGLLIARAAKGDVQTFLMRILPEMKKKKIAALTNAAENAVTKLGLPPHILKTNWVIDPFGQRRLYDRIVEKIHAGEIDDLIPTNPHEKNASSLYGAIFTRILKAVYKQQGGFGGYVSGLALKWMKGVPYPIILASEIKRAEKRYEKKLQDYMTGKLEDPSSRIRKPKPVDNNQIIRNTFELIESVVRFQFVQLGKAYIDLLSLALRNEGLSNNVPQIFDFALALELGIATKSGKSYIELGLSRIAASALEQLYPDTNLSVPQARNFLRDLDFNLIKLNPFIIEEMKRLDLVGGPSING